MWLITCLSSLCQSLWSTEGVLQTNSAPGSTDCGQIQCVVLKWLRVTLNMLLEASKLHAGSVQNLSLKLL